MMQIKRLCLSRSRVLLTQGDRATLKAMMREMDIEEVQAVAEDLEKGYDPVSFPLHLIRGQKYTCTGLFLRNRSGLYIQYFRVTGSAARGESSAPGREVRVPGQSLFGRGLEPCQSLQQSQLSLVFRVYQ